MDGQRKFSPYRSPYSAAGFHRSDRTYKGDAFVLVSPPRRRQQRLDIEGEGGDHGRMAGGQCRAGFAPRIVDANQFGAAMAIAARVSGGVGAPTLP